MPDGVKSKMESSFGVDFSEVNIHQNSERSSNIGALAYTQGNDVHFAPGQYNPRDKKGQELLGHELAHVVQQQQGRVKSGKKQYKGVSVNSDPALEKEADLMGSQVAQAKGNGSGYDNFPGDFEGGIKLTYSLSGGFSISLYGGISKKLQNLMLGTNASLTFIRGGAGTSKNSPNLLEFTLSPSLTLGYKEAQEIPLNLFIDQAGTGVQNPFKNSFTLGGNLVLSSGVNSDGTSRHQWLGAAGLRIGGAFSLNSYNDVFRFPFTGMNTDQFRSAGLNGSFQIGDSKFDWANDMYYGKSNKKATFKDDIVIGNHHYDDQNIYDLLLNNGRERFSFTNSKLGINESTIRSGAETFWPSNKMHDSMSIKNPGDGKEYPFHRLFVPYPNTSERLIEYLKFQELKRQKEQKTNNANSQ